MKQSIVTILTLQSYCFFPVPAIVVPRCRARLSRICLIQDFHFYRDCGGIDNKSKKSAWFSNPNSDNDCCSARTKRSVSQDIASLNKLGQNFEAYRIDFNRNISFSISSMTSLFAISSFWLNTINTLPPYFSVKSAKLAFIRSDNE